MRIKLFTGIAAVIFAIAFAACGGGGGSDGSDSDSSEILCTITFNANDGSGDPAPVQVVYGDPLPNISLQTPPERAGYYFTGYFDSPAGGTMYYTNVLTPAKSSWDKKYDTTLYAQWSLTPKVTIIFHKNDGNGETSTQSVEINKSTALSTNTFSREGYTFKGWSTTQTGSVEYADGASYSAGASSVDLYAIWTAKQYTITFNANGGSGGPASADVIYGESMPALIASAPTHTEYYFAGYYDAKTGGTMYYTAEMQSARTWDRTSATTLYARWTAIPEVTIIFNSNYGSNQTETQNVRENTSISLRENTFTRDGYKFDGWSTTPTGSVEYADEASYTAGVSTVNLYAVWAANTYTVNFNANNGTGGQTTPVTATYDAPMPSLSAPAPTRTGYYFAGYFNTTSGGEMYYTADMLSARTWDRTSDTTLYAQWTEIPVCTIVFHKNDGTNSQAIQNAYENTEIVLITNTFAREGYTFAGWSTTQSGSVEYADGANYSVGTSGITLYAKWDAITYTIGYDKNASDATGTTASSSHIYDIDKALTANGFTRSGYTFVCWTSNANGTGTSYTNGQSVKNLSTNHGSTVTLYAKWGITAATPQDTGDFGSGAVIYDIFNVSNLTEWDTAKNTINAGGSNKNYVINILSSFAVPAGNTFTPVDINISIRGTGTQTLSLSNNGNLLRITGNHVIIHDLILKGRTYNVDGADSDNNTYLIYVSGASGILELKGTARITGNVNAYVSEMNARDRYAGGVYLTSGTFIMRDNSAVSGNTVSATSNNGAYGYAADAWGGGVFNNSGTFIMWDNSTVSNNIAKAHSSGTLQPVAVRGGGVLNIGTLIMRGNASITNNSVAATGGSTRGAWGGGIWISESNILRIEGGTISGNTAASYTQLCLYPDGAPGTGEGPAIAQRGTYSGDTWNSLGNLSSTNSAISVINGVLQ